MQSKLSTFVARVGESGWLAALIIVPLLFNIYTERVFEEDKIPLMRSIALLMVVGLVIWAVERGRAAMQEDGRPWWKIPLVVPALVLAAAYLLSTVFSIVPRISFWGAYIRRQGTYTWLSYIVIFLSIVLLMRDRRQVTRLITVILLTSVPISLYAFLQNRGLDPLPWGGDVTRRVSSTAGNPIFISAYLIMVVPLTLMRVIEHFRQLLYVSDEEDDEGDEPNYLASSLLAGAYLFLLIIQLITIVFSQSRGPLIGLGVGLSFFLILFSLRLNRLWTLVAVALPVLGIAFLAVFNLPNSPLEPLREVRYIGRLGRVFEVDRGNGLVRALIWEGVTDLLAADPVRDIVGYGPEALYVAYNPYYPPRLAQVEQRNASPDRSHNETFDAIAMTGFVGFAAQLFFFLSVFYYVLKWLGLIRSQGQRAAFIALMIVSGIAGALIPYLLDGSFRFSGVGLPAGITLGLIAYLVAYGVTHLREGGEEGDAQPYSLLLIALLAAIAGHFVEAHFGIAIGATRLYFWAYSALVVVIGLPLLKLEADESEAAATAGRRKRRGGRARAAQGPILTPTLVTLSLMMGLILLVMAFDFYTPTISLTAKGGALIWLFLGTWLFGALVVVSEVAFEQEREGRWLLRLGAYAAISLSVWAIFSFVYIPWLQARPVSGSVTPEQLQALGARIANTITIVYLFTFFLIGLAAAALVRESSPARQLFRVPTWVTPLYGVLLASIVPVIVLTNLNVSRADVFSKQGAGYERNNQWDAAIVFYQTALDMQKDEDRYFLNMGRAYMEKARTTQDDPAQRTAYMEQARDVLERAQATNPLNTDHTRNLASLHRAWASMLDDPAEKARHYELADEYYARAVELSPNNASIWNDWASLKLERGDFEAALERLDRSLALDETWLNTYMLKATVALEQEEYERALETYNEALAVQANSLPALSGRAYALARLERIPEAIEANRDLLALKPDDYNTLKNLALLYEQSGQYELAMQAAQAALAVANPQEQAAMQAFIQQLSTQSQ